MGSYAIMLHHEVMVVNEYRHRNIGGLVQKIMVQECVHGQSF